MKKITLLFSFVAVLCLGVSAQSNGVAFQEASAREAKVASVNFFVCPQICDLKMLSDIRQDFGPYEFDLTEDLNHLSEVELENIKTRALNRACTASGADLILEPFYTSTVYSNDLRKISIRLTGFPAKYHNFRSITTEDLIMLQNLYNTIGVRSSEEIITTTTTTNVVE